MPTELYENLEAPKKAVLAAVDTGEYDVETSLEELRELARTAGYPVVGTATQKLQSPVAATFMGSGRLLELKEYLEAVEADLIIFDEELSPAQLRNIEELCDCPVLDRTMLILDIFAARAASGEGKLQVELARLQYQLPRLAGRGVQLSRQGGGGTGGTGARRGAGESKLEVDRRHIRRRIDALKTELAALARRREQRRTRRKKDGVTTVAIVGYTNVGKSTLLKVITQIMRPSSGSVRVRGKVSALLELASGFDGDLNLKENAYLRGAMLGYTREFMNERYPEILKFSELEEFEQRPFKQLSSGMKSRIAFSIASMVDPEILILDEVLSVGDGAFREKSEAKMKEIIRNGKATILVSHSLDQIRRMCNKVLWLDHGRQIAFGETEKICGDYAAFLKTKELPKIQ